jgi:hypothetical protein
VDNPMSMWRIHEPKTLRLIETLEKGVVEGLSSSYHDLPLIARDMSSTTRPSVRI